MTILTIGTRGSPLALKQADWVGARLRGRYPWLDIRIEPITAPADASPDVPISRLGTKGLFTKTLEEALLEGRIDLAVHSLKDMASAPAAGLTLAAIPAREDPREAFVSLGPSGLTDLPAAARVGTGSPRRRAQLLALRPDLRIEEIRGNIETRLRKLHAGQYDALILAAAGLHRLNRHDAITGYLDPAVLLPAGGQGALGIQARAGDNDTIALAAALADREATLCCIAERRLQEVLEGGCRVPIGALASLDFDQLTLDALVATEDGTLLVRDRLSGPANAPVTLGERLAERLVAAGADAILRVVRSAER